MGDKQIRAKAEQAGAEALRSEFEVLGDLAVAADAASKADEIRAAAQVKAQQILDSAEQEIARRQDLWRTEWQRATELWKETTLRSAPLNLRKPPAASKTRAKRTVAGKRRSPSGDSDRPATGQASPGDAGAVQTIAQSA